MCTILSTKVVFLTIMKKIFEATYYVLEDGEVGQGKEVCAPIK